MNRNDAGDKERILQERAVALAREHAAVSEEADTFEVTAFRLGKEAYLLDSRLIREIVPLKGLTPLPCVPPFIAGIMNLRGRILSLVNLHQLLGLAQGCDGDGCNVLVLTDGEMEFGIIADAIDGVMRIADRSGQEHLPGVPHTQRKYLRGVTAERFILLDGHRLLHDPELIIQDEVL